MKKIMLLTMAALLLAANLSPVWAEGGKVRGDKGDGPTKQEGPTPFTG